VKAWLISTFLPYLLPALMPGIGYVVRLVLSELAPRLPKGVMLVVGAALGEAVNAALMLLGSTHLDPGMGAALAVLVREVIDQTKKWWKMEMGELGEVPKPVKLRPVI
jgi:hypothetical protein